MKRVYESPVMMLEGFEANEYVAACWDVYCNGYSATGWAAKQGASHESHSHSPVGIAKTDNESEPTTQKVFTNPGKQDSLHLNCFNDGNMEHWEVVYSRNERPNAS